MKKYNLSKIMKRAWELVKTSSMDLSSALRQAWAEAKKELIVAGLEAQGFKRWTKNGMDRMYVNAEALGLQYDANFQHGTFNGEAISNSKVRSYRASKNYIDLADMSVHSDYFGLCEELKKRLAVAA